MVNISDRVKKLVAEWLQTHNGPMPLSVKLEMYAKLFGLTVKPR